MNWKYTKDIACKSIFSALFLINLCSYLDVSAATPLAVKDVSSFGESGDSRAFDILTTSDNNYIVVGRTNSPDWGSGTIGSHSSVISKIDATGTEQWVSFFGGSKTDIFEAVTESADGGFIAVGNSTSTDAGFTNKGKEDGIVVKYDKNGNQQWIKSFGGSSNEYLKSVTQTSDEGFVVAGRSDSTNAGFTSNGGYDAIIIKYDKNGNQKWVKNFGGSGVDSFSSIVETKDGGVICVGYSNSTNAGLTNKGSNDAIIVKYDSNGIQQWVKNFGGSSSDLFDSVVETDDGGFVAVGESNSNNAGFVAKGNTDAIIVKYDRVGNQQWVKNIGGSGSDNFKNIITDSNNDLVVVGASASVDGPFANKGALDSILVKYDSLGNELSIASFGGSSNESFYGVVQIDDNNYIATGYSSSSDAGFTLNGSADVILVELKEPAPPLAPSIERNKTTGTIKISEDISELDGKEISYSINGSPWITYMDEIIPVYDENGICRIEAKSINVFDIESIVVSVEFSQTLESRDINVLFQQPHTLSITLSNNSVDFGEITGIDDIEGMDTISTTITSSSPYNISVKATDDIKGSADNRNIIDISNLSVKIDTSSYKPISKNYTTVLSGSPKGYDMNHVIGFKLSSTMGAKADAYSVPIKINVEQI